MLIGIDASRANRLRKTGTEWYSYYLIRWLARLDHANQYVLYADKPLQGGLLDLASEAVPAAGEPVFDKQGFQAIKSPGNNFKAKVLKWPFTYFWSQGRLSLEMALHCPDVLFVPAHALPLIHPRRSVVTIHDIGYEEKESAYSRQGMGRGDQPAPLPLNLLVWLSTGGRYQANNLDYLRWSTAHTLKKADRIIAISEFTKDTIARIYGRERDVTVIANGYNRQLYRKIADQKEIGRVLRRYGIDGPYLFYIGRIERKKNIPALIEAFAIMKDKHRAVREKLVLVGNASYGYDEVNYVIRQFDLIDDVIMPGWIDEADVPYLYNGATAFVFPSLYEGFGLPLLQAMACETPVIASDVTSIPEVVGGAALLFNPNFVSSIADALGRICLDADLRRRLAASGREQVKAFGWEKTAAETMKVITYQ